MDAVKLPIDTLERFNKHVKDDDDFIVIVLKGHLLVEEALERVVKTITPHGKYLDKAKLSFFQKVVIAQSMSWEGHDSRVWDLIYAINTVRNDLVHQLESAKLENKIRTTLNVFLDAINKASLAPDLQQVLEHSTSHDKIGLALVVALGFLQRYESEAIAYREVIDALYENMNS